MSNQVPSPCTGVCRIETSSGLCEGCCRTMDEIVTWASLGDAAKLRVWKLLRTRRAVAEAGSPNQDAAAGGPFNDD